MLSRLMSVDVFLAERGEEEKRTFATWVAKSQIMLQRYSVMRVVFEQMYNSQVIYTFSSIIFRRWQHLVGVGVAVGVVMVSILF